MALPPCHLLYQVWTSPADPLTHQRRLSAKVYMRSADSFLGVPFNIASYALLTHLLAQLTGHVADRLHLAFGDFHLYRHHVEAARTQLERTSRPFPKIRWNRPLLNTDIDHIRAEDFTIYDYFPHDRISAKMAI
jgi:thymidylate synthase